MPFQWRPFFALTLNACLHRGDIKLVRRLILRIVRRLALLTDPGAKALQELLVIIFFKTN